MPTSPPHASSRDVAYSLKGLGTFGEVQVIEDVPSLPKLMELSSNKEFELEEEEFKPMEYQEECES